jgi:hypothetical protein
MSFAADMKDFISAAQAGQKMVGAKDDRAYKQALTAQSQATTEALNQKNNDTEGQAADLELKRARTRNLDGATGLQGARGQLVRAQLKALTAAPAPDPTIAGTAGRSTIAPATTDETPPAEPAPKPAVNPGPAIGATQPMPGVSDDGDNPIPMSQKEKDMMAGVFYSHGGSVQKYAGGGAVADDEDAPDDGEPDATETAPEGAVPGDAGTSSTTDISARSRGAPSFSYAAGVDGVHAGLTYGAKALGLHAPAGVDTPGRQRAAKAWATGAHAAPVQDIEAIKASVDPEGKLPESSRNLAAIGAVYQFKMAKGDTEGAAKAAFQMIQHYRQASQRYAVIAAAAAEKGDLDTATHAAMKAYANVPDGQSFHVEKTDDGQLSYTITDEKTGKVKKQGIASPEKLAASAMGFAQKGFDESLMAAVQQRPTQQPKPAVDPDIAPMKSADKKTALKQIDDAYAEQNPDDPKTSEPKYKPADKTALTGAAFRMAVHSKNTRLTPAEAMDVTTKIADPTTLDAAGFATKKTDGGYRVRIGKQEVFVPEKDFDALLERRNAKIESLKPKKDADGPGLVSRATKAFTDFRDDNKRRSLSADFTEPSVP